MCCCDSQTNIKEKFGTILGKLQTLRKICRVIALLDAIFGLMFLIILIARHTMKVQQQNAWSDANIVRVFLLSFLGLQIFFALLLYEGARRGILCLIKAWLIFSLIRMIFHALNLSITLIKGHSSGNGNYSKDKWPQFAFEIGATVFQVVEALIILAFHKKAKNSQNNENTTKDDLPEREHFWMELDDMKDIRCSYLPSAPLEDVVVIENPETSKIPTQEYGRGVSV